MQVISNPPGTYYNSERHFQTGFFCCSVTRQMDKCIRIKLGDLPLPDGKVAEVHANLSEEGLKSLMTDLQSAPPPLNVPSAEEVRAGAAYQWGVILEDGTHLQQYPATGGETPFSAIHLPDVKEFWIIPREKPDALPWFGLLKDTGFVIGHHKEGQPTEWKPLTRFGLNGVEEPLPFPKDEPFWYQYYRQNTLTFGMYSAGQDSAIHLAQVLGWRVGEDTIFELAIEDDGSWAVWKDEGDTVRFD